ncbi:MAG: type III pantothenate kinase [Phycisphaerales bacterium]|nr:type III pantothenate kinase [Phycisphaerales bacterium]
MANVNVKFFTINVGNSRTQFTCIEAEHASEPAEVLYVSNAEPSEAIDRIAAHWRKERADADTRLAMAMASVNTAVSDRLLSGLEAACDTEVFRIGEDLPVPIETNLEPGTSVGVDRLLGALAAFGVTERACVVIDAGTAVTVDYVDSDGVFRGGAILLGAQLQLDALHSHTSLLPDLTYTPPDDEPWGRSTAGAMMHGVHHGLRGAIRMLTERYAEHTGSYPQVIATGGDAEALFADDPFVEKIVPHLTLLGIAITCRHALEAGGEGDGS